MVWLPGAVDLFILPRAALVVGFGALLLGLGLPGPRGLRLPLLALALAAVLAAAFSINPWLSIAGAYTRYESVVVRLAYVGLLVGSAVLTRRPASRELALRLFLAGCAVAGLVKCCT